MTSERSSLPALLEDRSAYRARLELIMPASLIGTGAACSGIAAAAAFTLMYVGAIDQQKPVRPAMVVGMSDAAARHRQPEKRLAWYEAAKRVGPLVEALEARRDSTSTDVARRARSVMSA